MFWKRTEEESIALLERASDQSAENLVGPPASSFPNGFALPRGMAAGHPYTVVPEEGYRRCGSAVIVAVSRERVSSFLIDLVKKINDRVDLLIRYGERWPQNTVEMQKIRDIAPKALEDIFKKFSGVIRDDVRLQLAVSFRDHDVRHYIELKNNKKFVLQPSERTDFTHALRMHEIVQRKTLEFIGAGCLCDQPPCPLLTEDYRAMVKELCLLGYEDDETSFMM